MRTFANEALSQRQYDASIDLSFAQGKRLALAQGGFLSFAQTLFSSATLLVLWYGSTLVIREEISAGALISFLLYTVMLGGSFAVLSSLFGDFMKAVGASERIFGLFDRRPAMPIEGGAQPANLQAHVELEGVTFSYPSRPDSMVLRDVSLAVPEGKTIALVGASGGGKSTVIALIERLYDPSAGVIRIGGHDVKTLDPKWLKTQVALVSQEPTLFCVSIADNIRYGRAEATDEEVVAAAKQANAHGAPSPRARPSGMGSPIAARLHCQL